MSAPPAHLLAGYPAGQKASRGPLRDKLGLQPAGCCPAFWTQPQAAVAPTAALARKASVTSAAVAPTTAVCGVQPCAVLPAALKYGPCTCMQMLHAVPDTPALEASRKPRRSWPASRKRFLSVRACSADVALSVFCSNLALSCTAPACFVATKAWWLELDWLLLNWRQAAIKFSLSSC